MNVEAFFDLFFNFLRSIFDTLGSYSITAFGVSVPLTIILGTAIILSMLVSVFWRGAKG